MVMLTIVICLNNISKKPKNKNNQNAIFKTKLLVTEWILVLPSQEKNHSEGLILLCQIRLIMDQKGQKIDAKC